MPFHAYQGKNRDDPSNLFHAPMSLMALWSSLEFYELSIPTFLVISALQCGMAVPSSITQASNWFPHFDPFGHITLNTSLENARIHTHDQVVHILASTFPALGLSATDKVSAIPTLASGPHPNSHGDILIRKEDVCLQSLSNGLQPHNRIVFDVALVNPFTVSDGVVSCVSSRLIAAETEKIRHYRSKKLSSPPDSSLIWGSSGHSGWIQHVLRVRL